MITKHRITDEWKIELDGKIYWVTRIRSDGYAVTWQVENVRVVGGHYGTGEAIQACVEGGRVWKRVVSWMKEQL